MKKQLTAVLLLLGIYSQAQVGIGTTTPNSTLDVRGSASAKYTSFSASTSATANDNMLVFTGTSAATLTLPDATTCQGRYYWIKSTSSNSSTLTIATTSSQTIDGLASWSISQINKVVRVVSNGTNWLVASETVPGASGGTSWIYGGNNVPSMQNLGTTSNHDLPFITNNTEKMRLTSTGRLGLGTSTFNGTYPEKLLVDAGLTGNTNYQNVIVGKGNTNSYAQLNIQNNNAGTTASSDVVATSNNGSESINFVDMGINSGSNTTTGVLGGANTAYLYSTGADFAIGNGSNNRHLNFFTTESANYTERMRITNTGNVGISTTTPSEKLDVAGNIRISGGNKRLLFAGMTNDPDAVIELHSAQNNEQQEMLFYVGNDVANTFGPDRIRMVGEEFKFESFNAAWNSSLANAESETNLNTRLYINPSGNVAIGTTAFDNTNPEKLLVDAGIDPPSFNLIAARGTKDDYLQLNIQNRSNGNSASSDIVASADNATEVVNYIDMGINSSSYSNSATNILNGINRAYLYATGREFYIGNGGNNYPLVFFTNNSGTSGTNGTERMRINAAGDVCIGTTTQNGANKLTVNGSISATAFNVSSDRRLKTNIRHSYYGLKHIMALQPVSWSWKDQAQDATPQLGLIAQDVKQLIPEIVSGNEETGTLSINYTELIPVLVNAIKEQQQQIDHLKKKIESLERR